MSLDDDSRRDLMEAFSELQADAEASLESLKKQWDDETIHSLFRSIHNIKGNASMMGVQGIVDFTHKVEEVVGALRQIHYSLSKPISEALLIALDRISDLHQQEILGKKFDYLYTTELETIYQNMAEARSQQAADGCAMEVLQLLGAGIVEENTPLASEQEITKQAPPVQREAQSVQQHSRVLTDTEEKLKSDLNFFQELALQIDDKHENWSGRCTQLYDWAMQMNQLAGNPVNPQQFSAAIYLHDIGMELIPEELWEKKLDLDPKENKALARHPEWAYELLVRIPGWEEAATMVKQHHEHIDGSGYPRGLKGDDIHDGAKILVILDTFFFLTKGRVDASARKSTVRAVSVINTRVDTEFEGLWVQCFNHVIRKELKEGNI